jgi:hypothetical protein
MASLQIFETSIFATYVQLTAGIGRRWQFRGNHLETMLKWPFPRDVYEAGVEI